jgi:hypothetical protein
MHLLGNMLRSKNLGNHLEQLQQFDKPTACSVGWWLMAGAGLF